jgi:AcrR family transcriptional regulator
MSPTKRPAESTDALRASLIEDARRIIARDGTPALTMRALAAEAGCSIGLPYKVFPDRRALVVEIVATELERLSGASHELRCRAGTGTVAGNLVWFADLLLESPAVALHHELASDEALSARVNKKVRDERVGPEVIETALAHYLAAEQQAGRVDPAVDTDAFGFLIGGALHNLIAAGEAWPRPTRRQLRRRLAAIAATIAKEGQHDHQI